MKQPITRVTYVRLGKRVRMRGKQGLWTPLQCKACGSVWKQVVEIRRGARLLKRRVTCFMCGKRQYGQRAEVGR